MIFITPPKPTKKEQIKYYAIWLGIGILLNILSVYALTVLFDVIALWIVVIHCVIFSWLGSYRANIYFRDLMAGKVEELIKQQKITEDNVISDASGTGNNQDNTQV